MGVKVLDSCPMLPVAMRMTRLRGVECGECSGAATLGAP